MMKNFLLVLIAVLFVFVLNVTFEKKHDVARSRKLFRRFSK